MSREHLSWLSGTLSHLHLRHPQERRDNPPFEIRQFTHLTALKYLNLLSGAKNMRVTDTNHALMAFADLDNLRRPEGVDKESWAHKIITHASDSTLARIEEVRRSQVPNVILGIEVDIIGSEGELSLNAEVLNKLDFVVASFHRFIWTIFSEQTRFAPDYLVRAYLSVLDNPHVDVLGHSTRVSSKITGEITVEDYRPIIEKMKMRGVAFEINIAKDLRHSSEELTLGVVRLCIEYGVPLIMSLDFHQFIDFKFLEGLPMDGEITEENVEQVFQSNGSGHFRFFRRIIRNISILQKLGVKKEMVVNASNEAFDSWLSQRRVLRSALDVST